MPYLLRDLRQETLEHLPVLLMNPKLISYENRGYEKWIKKKPCLICGQSPVDGHHMRHARSNALMLTPLCRSHHQEYHRLEHQAFEDKFALVCDWAVMALLMEYIESKRDVEPLEQLERE